MGGKPLPRGAQGALTLGQLAWLTPHSRGSCMGPQGGEILFSTLLVLFVK